MSMFLFCFEISKDAMLTFTFSQDIDILWEKPTLRYIAQGNLTEIDQVPNLNVYHLPESEKVSQGSKPLETRTYIPCD